MKASRASMPVIRLRNINKLYEVHHDKQTLIETILGGKNETFYALRDINITTHKGERVGIVGGNGSGKTTLLKLMADTIYTVFSDNPAPPKRYYRKLH